MYCIVHSIFNIHFLSIIYLLFFIGIYKPSEEIVYDEHFPVERHDFISCLAREWENCAKPAYTMRTVTVRSIHKTGAISTSGFQKY